MTQFDPNGGGWLVHDGGRQLGPYSDAELASFLASGAISPSALVWRQGMPQWISIGALHPPAPGVGVAPPHFAYPGPPPSALASASSNKIAAGICGILLGALGIHKFILGYTAAGVITLCISLLTCGLGAPIMSILGLIEGIIYLTKSDAEFYREYVVNRKEWF